jgi:hypothetical protein
MEVYNKHKKKLKITVLAFFVTVISIVVLSIIFISPITKYVVEKYDERIVGRKITLDWAYVNPFTGYVYFKNLKVYEQNSDSLFFSATGTSANFAIHKLLSRTYEITQLTLDNPDVKIIQTKHNLNWDDLVEKFSSKSTPGLIKKPVMFSIIKIQINNGKLHYRETITPINIAIKKLNLESSGIRWNSDTISATCTFLSGLGKGDVKGDFCINTKNLDYRIDANFKKLDLNFVNQYLVNVTNNGHFKAILDADLKTTGNFQNAQDLNAKGKVILNEFHFGKNATTDFAAFDKLIVDINQLNPKKHEYLIDSLMLFHPYFKYQMYDYLDNVQVMFGKKGDLVSAENNNPVKFNLVLEIGKYVQVLSKNFFMSNYKINQLAIYNGHLKFDDYSLSEKFSVDLNPLTVVADSINKNHDRVNAVFKSNIKPYGNVSVALSINPKDSSDFDMQYHLQNIPVSMFNPYVVAYTSFPLDRGTIEINGKWKVRNGNIQSNNHLVIIDPRVTKRLRNKDVKWIPVPLLFFFIRERGNVIDYEIPISGNLRSPKFHLRDVFYDLLENIFVKAPTTPYRIEVKSTEREIEKSLTLKWDIRCSSITKSQERFIKKMADFLIQNPHAFISVYPQQYTLKEKEYILFFEAKKQYFLTVNNKNSRLFTKKDSSKVDKISVKDSLFVHYLNKQTKGIALFTVQEKCAACILPTIINSKFEQLNKQRMNAFMVYFKKQKVEKQIKMYFSRDVIPYDGCSFYKIKYNEKLPESLIKANREMNELNDVAPRKKFEKYRKRSNSDL